MNQLSMQENTQLKPFLIRYRVNATRNFFLYTVASYLFIYHNADMFGWSSPACQFPSWLTSVTLQDLSGRHITRADPKGEVLNVYYQRKPTSEAHIRAVYR